MRDRNFRHTVIRNGGDLIAFLLCVSRPGSTTGRNVSKTNLRNRPLEACDPNIDDMKQCLGCKQ